MTCPSQNTNFLSPNGFILTIERLKNVAYFSQTVTLPSISLGELEQPTPLNRNSIPADQLQWTPLIITFIVDSMMKNYIEIFKWMQGLGFPENYNQYTTEMKTRVPPVAMDLPTNYSDASLTVIDAFDNPIKTFTFVDIWPMSLEGITFATTNADVQYATSSVTFGYSYFKID